MKMLQNPDPGNNAFKLIVVLVPMAHIRGFMEEALPLTSPILRMILLVVCYG